MLPRVFCALLLLYLAAPAQNDSLAALRATLATLHKHRSENANTLGARAELTVAKHQLRDWVEQRLTSLGATPDEDASNRAFQEALAGLFCPDGCVFSALGFIDTVRLRHNGEFLVIRTSVGIRCGYDDASCTEIDPDSHPLRVF